MSPIRVGILGYDGVCSLDVFGPLEAFASASIGGGPGYELVVIGLNTDLFVAATGVAVRPHATIGSVTGLDTLLIPGGPGARSPEMGQKLSSWLRTGAPKIRRVASICTGIYLLAPTGLLDGRRVTTHWRYAHELALRFPKLRVDHDALFLKSDRYYTSAGITAGIDLSIALIEEDYGAEVALDVARELVVYLKRPGGQRQYSEPLRLQVGSNDTFAGLLDWMVNNLSQDLSVEALASRAGLSRRQFGRLFKVTFGRPPSEVVQDVRLDHARTLLATPNARLENVATAVGFGSADAFGKAFARRFGIPPSGYRTLFVSE